MKPFFWVREVTKEKSCQNPGHNQYLRTIGAGFSHLPIKHNKEKTLPIKSFCFFYFFTPKRDKKSRQRAVLSCNNGCGHIFMIACFCTCAKSDSFLLFFFLPNYL